MSIAEKLTTIAENEPKVYNAGQISVLQNSKYMYPTVSGEIIRIDDMANVPHKVRITKRSDTEVDLEAVKVKKLGKNLATAQQVYGAQTDIYYSELAEDERNCIRFVDCANASVGKSIPFKENTRYTFSFDGKREIRGGEGYATSVFLRIYYTDGTSNNIAYSNTTMPYGEWVHCSYTSLAGKTIEKIGVPSYHWLNWLYIDVDTFQIEESATATEYEPYSMEYVNDTFDSTPNIVTLVPDTSGVVLDCEYLRDIDKYIDSLNVAVAMTGGA